MKIDKLEDRLWNLANIITAYAIVQSVTFSYTAVQGRFADIINNNNGVVRLTLSIFFILLCSLECIAIVWCHKRIGKIEDFDNTMQEEVIIKKTKIQIMMGQISCVVIFTALAYVALYARPLLGK